MTDALLDRFVDRLAAADRDGALAVALSLDPDGPDLDHIVQRLVVPAQVEVGRRWERNEWSVAQEHAATVVSEWVLAAVAAREDRGSPQAPAGRLVAVCAEGEWHSLPVRTLTEIVRRAGWDVTLLGPSVPSGQLARFLHDEGPDGLLLSCSIPFNLPGARRVIEATRATGTPVMVGGRAFGSDDRRAKVLGADAWAVDARSAVERLADWRPFTTPAPPLTHPGVEDHLRLERDRLDLVDRTVALMATRFPAMASYDEDQTARTTEDVDYLFRFLSAALLVDDPRLLEDYVGWLEVVLTSRGVPSRAVPLSLEVAAEVAVSLPRAQAVLRDAVDGWRPAG